MTYDEAVLGEVTSEDELAEYMTEYDRDWYLGTETDHDWQLSIIQEKPFLFSLGRDKGKVRPVWLPVFFSDQRDFYLRRK